MPTPSPTATATPDPRRQLVVFVSDWGGDDDVYLFDPLTSALVDLSNAPGEERDPVFSPDGHWVIYRANGSGAWRYERINLATGERMPMPGDDLSTTAYRGRLAPLPLPGAGVEGFYESYRDGVLNLYGISASGRHGPALPTPAMLTDAQGQAVPAGNYAPAWRPDGQQIAFTSWRDGNKAIYVASVSGIRAVAPSRLMDSPFDDEYPTWHPSGQRLVFMRWQNHDADLYEFDTGDGTVTRLTDDPYPDRSPAFAPDGTLFWIRYEPGAPFELHDPFRPGQWRLWMRGKDGREQPVALPVDNMDVAMPAAGFAQWPGWAAEVIALLPTATPDPGRLIDLVKLDIACAGGDPSLNALLVADYAALRQDVLDRTGYDVFGTISDMARPLGYSGRNYGHLSWHRTGRALDLLFEWRDPPDGPNRLMVVRETLGPQTYWRLYLRTREQDSSMGEPITVAPWIFWFDLDRSIEPQAYTAGGKPGAIPPGYYVDITKLAKRHGWHRIAAYEEDDFDWKWDSVGREFWHYQRTDGLTWWQAMRQVYPLATLETFYGWTVCSEKLGLDRSWLEGKGIPAPTPISGANP